VLGSQVSQPVGSRDTTTSTDKGGLVGQHGAGGCPASVNLADHLVGRDAAPGEADLVEVR